jgi:hypothetical protein
MAGQQFFDRAQAFVYPVLIPGVFLRIARAQHVLQIAQDAHVVDGVDVAGNGVGQFQHPRARQGVGGYQTRFGMRGVQVIDDGQ